MVQVGTFVEVTFERTGQKRLFRLDSGAVSLLDEIVLLVHDRVVGQNSQRFAPYAVQALVLGGGLREYLREFHPESDGKVAFLLTIQPCSTARSGKQLSSDTVLSVPCMVVEVISDSYKTSYSAAANDAARQTKPRKQFHHPVLPVARVKTEDTPDECSARSAADEDADSGGKAGKVHRNEQQEETQQSAGKKVKVLRPQAVKLHTGIDALVDIIRAIAVTGRMSAIP